MKVKRIIDVTRRIFPGVAVWPGDKGVKIIRDISIKNNGLCNLSSIQMGLHTGTHIDAPFHFIDGGDDVSLLDLSKFIGCVKVFDVKVDSCITADDIKDLPICEGDIVFLKTSNSLLPDEEVFVKNFIYIDVSAANLLVEKKVRTIGVDYFSVDGFELGRYDVHKLFLSNRIGIIEGLCLKDADEGRYFFSGLPLRIEGVDGSPARVVLAEMGE